MKCSRCGAKLRAGNHGPLCSPCLEVMADLGHDPACPFPQTGECDCITGRWRSFWTLVKQDGWTARAACRGREGSEVSWFPEYGSETRGGRSSVGLRRERRAKRICAMCPVKRECLTRAFMVGERFGLWAGVHAGTIQADLRMVQDGTYASLKEAIDTRLELAYHEALEHGFVTEEEVVA